MKRIKPLVGLLAGAAALCLAGAASATVLYENYGDTSAYVNDWATGSDYINYAFNSTTDAFVGSWEVDQGPSWSTVPTAYSGLTAAALLFGGSPSDYVISTIDNDPANIDGLAWVSTWGGACDGAQPCGTKVADDFVRGTNPGGVPEPAAWTLMLIGVAGLGFSLRTRRQAAAV